MTFDSSGADLVAVIQGVLVTFTSVIGVEVFKLTSVIHQVICEVPTLSRPLASAPVPSRVVAPVIVYLILRIPQLSLYTGTGIEYMLFTDLQYVCCGGVV